MFTQPDNTFNDIRQKSLEAWLADIEQHDDITVRGGVKLCRDYIKHLEDEMAKLKDENELKNSYLRKMAKKS